MTNRPTLSQYNATAEARVEDPNEEEASAVKQKVKPE